MDMVLCSINGIPVKVEKGTSILKAAEQVQVKIPTLCAHPDLPAWAACGICVVKLENSPKMLRACSTPVEEGMRIITHDAEIFKVRKTVIQLILSTHPNDCLQCSRNQDCELQRLTAEFGIRQHPFPQKLRDLPKDESTTSIVLNPEKCVLCGRCAIVCQQLQNVWALEFLGRGESTRIAPAADADLEQSPCIKCGQCSAHCPVGAIYEKSECEDTWKVLQDKDKYCIVQIAPAVRVAIGEAFGYEPGELLTGKLYAALRRMGFKAVFDTNFGADLTIFEEGYEFLNRFVNKSAVLPQITSCCPAWVDYMEKYYSDLIPNFSTAKSPHEMVGALAKTYYAEKMGIPAEKIVVVSIMPCTAKKFEISRVKDMFSSGFQDVDISLTTREVARMIKSAGIDFKNLPDAEADSILGTYAGAATIFGVTGGVMEAALRTVQFKLTGKELENPEFMEIRGLEGVKTATYTINNIPVKVAVAHGMANIATVLDEVREAAAQGKPAPYHFIEVMACRGGCVGGGGQPYGATDEIRQKRAMGIYKDDVGSKKRCSHENPDVIRLYEEFLKEPLSEKSHHLLHTHYIPRPIYQK